MKPGDNVNGFKYVGCLPNSQVAWRFVVFVGGVVCVHPHFLPRVISRDGKIEILEYVDLEGDSRNRVYGKPERSDGLQDLIAKHERGGDVRTEYKK